MAWILIPVIPHAQLSHVNNGNACKIGELT